MELQNLTPPCGAAGPEHERTAGFSLVETMITLVLAVLVVYSVHSTLQTTLSGQVAANQLYATQRMANDLMARLRAISFGTVTDPPASALALDELFDDDEDFGPITLHQLAVAPSAPGYSFRTNMQGVVGTWRVKVDRDLDGNGDTDGPREGRDDVFRIAIFFDEALVLSTLRAADPSFTQVDVGAVYR